MDPSYIRIKRVLGELPTKFVFFNNSVHFNIRATWKQPRSSKLALLLIPAGSRDRLAVEANIGAQCIMGKYLAVTTDSVREEP